MPTLVSETQVKLEWSDINSRVQPPKQHPGTRTSGVHLSGVIKHVLVKLGMLTQYEVDEDEMPIRMALGMAWEDWAVGLQRAASDQFVWQPGELNEDGVLASPDGLNQLVVADAPDSDGDNGGGSDGEQVLEEFKLTWKSRHKYAVDKPITMQSLWMWQLAGYCYMLGITVARLHVMWVNGDYRPPSPDYRIYTIRFPQSELDTFWKQVVLRYRDDVAPERH